MDAGYVLEHWKYAQWYLIHSKYAVEYCRQRGQSNGNETQETTHVSHENANLSVLPQDLMPAMFWNIRNMLNGVEYTPNMLWNAAGEDVRKMAMIHYKQHMHHMNMLI